MVAATRNDAAARLRLHSISGYEWECSECHYHFAFGSGGNRDRICTVCQKEIPDHDEGDVDSTGRPVDHGELVTRDQALEALAAERRATVDRLRALVIAGAGRDRHAGTCIATESVERFLDEEASR